MDTINEPIAAVPTRESSDARKSTARVSTTLGLASLVAVGLGLMVPGAAVAAPCGSNGQARCELGNAPLFSETAFADQVADEVDAFGLKGWSMTLVDRDGREIVRISQGFANSAAGRPFYATTVSGIGSVSKVLTEAAVRHAIELNQALPNTPCAGVFTLDTPFLDALPSMFSQIAHSSYADVTIEEIITHRGGVPGTNNPGPASVPPGQHWNRRYDYYDTMTKTDISKPCTRGSRCYRNDNYVIATMMLPIIRSCNLRPVVDAWSWAACGSIVNAQDRAECQIQIAFDTLGVASNEIVQEWILDPLDIEATCDPLDNPVVNGQRVALAYSSAMDTTGELVKEDVRACGVGRWFMSSQDLARAMRYVDSGSFFLSRANATDLPSAHSGDLEGLYQARFRRLSRGFYYAFETNQPFDVLQADAVIKAAFDDAQGGHDLGDTPSLMHAIRGDWNCDRVGSSNDVILQVYGINDVRLFSPLGRQGLGAKDIWYVSTNEYEQASGTYVYYPALGSPTDDLLATGSWTLVRTAPDRLEMTRRDDGGWTGDYICSPA